MKGGDEGLDRS